MQMTYSSTILLSMVVMFSEDRIRGKPLFCEMAIKNLLRLCRTNSIKKNSHT